MNKAEAIAELDISERTLANYVKNGRLPVNYVKGKTGKIADYDPADITRLKEEMAGEARFARPATMISTSRASTASNVGYERVATRERSARGEALATHASSATTLARVEPSNQVGQGIDLIAVLGEQIASGLAEALTIQNLAAKTVLTFPEAATFTGISEKRLRDAAREGHLISSKSLGRGQKLRRIDLDKWVDSKFAQ